MSIKKVLVANRGEIALRILRSAKLIDIETCALYAEADRQSRHLSIADHSCLLSGNGPAAYLDAKAIVALAQQQGCDALHPGYGFLSESARLAELTTEAGIQFVGLSAENLRLFGDKANARQLAGQHKVPVLPGVEGDLSVVQAFLKKQNKPIMLKARAGGGGRGMRLVTDKKTLAKAWTACQSEAKRAFGEEALYAEVYLADARHIEVQVLGDRSGVVEHLYDRDCSLQRRFQKIIECAPAPNLPEEIRNNLFAAAIKLAQSQSICGLITFEFLVDTKNGQYFFIEANPRLQVEHTVTEAITGLDLVAIQLQLASGVCLNELGLGEQKPEPKGFALEVRINAETTSADGTVKPTAGTLSLFQPAVGPGIRVDTHAYSGYKMPTAFDSLLAKLIVQHPHNFKGAVEYMLMAINDFQINGIETNLPLLQAILLHPDISAMRTDNQWINRHLPELVQITGTATHLPDEMHNNLIRSPVQGSIRAVQIANGDQVGGQDELMIIEAMKMEYVVAAPCAGIISRIHAQVDDKVAEGQVLLSMTPTDIKQGKTKAEPVADPNYIRPDLSEALQRHALGFDKNRPASVEKRRKIGRRTARENLDDLCDSDSFIEYGPLVIAAQKRRRSLEDLMVNTPADGLIGGLCTVNIDLFQDEQKARCLALSYDYTVLAGTQGYHNHRKKDRFFELAAKMRCPVVLFAEGGGGRPGDTDSPGIAGLDCLAFSWFAELSALVPLIGIVSGRCFAGNAALLGCCDVVIATKDANIGMGGPAMIEGGGLGIFRPEEVGPTCDQVPNGVIDILAEDEAEAVGIAKQYLSYFQGNLSNWACQDSLLLRTLIPENRLRAYDIRTVIEALADTGSVLELRPCFGISMVTALARFEGRSVGIIANDPRHLAGAIDSQAADKASRFMQLCDAFGLPILSLCDCPGIMVGPDVEKQALVRHAARMFVTGANLSVPCFSIILRKAYGLGAQAMAAGSFKKPLFTIAWPTGEFGGMGLEGAVRLGYRKELESIEDPEKRMQAYQELVDRMYERGKAVNMASVFEIDDVIDPAQSRFWILRALKSLPVRQVGDGKVRPNIDTW